MDNSQTFNISTSTIFRIIIILLGLVFLYFIRDILLIIFVSVIIAAAMNGPVSWLQNHKIHRILGVLFVYLIFLLLAILVITIISPVLAEQIKQLANYFPELIEKVNIGFQEWWGQYRTDVNLQSFLDNFSNKLNQATSSIFGTVVGLFGGLFSFGIVLVISFYLAVQEKGVKRFFISMTPSEHQHYVSDLINRIQIRIGGWLRGQLLLMLIIGSLTFIGLYFLGVKYALTLALIAGILELIPYIGPFIALIPAVILAFVQSPMLALLVIVLYVVIQQLENYVIVPQVMKKAVNLNPIVIIIAMLIGAKLAGVMGIILSIPLTAAVAEFLKDFQK